MPAGEPGPKVRPPTKRTPTANKTKTRALARAGGRTKTRGGTETEAGAKRNESVFAGWSDADFYSDSATHVYFYNSQVDAASVLKLRADIHAANAGGTTASGAFVHPKPIVVHVNSPGGYVEPGFRLMTIFEESRVPVCTLIEGTSASASTFLSLFAPYRVMTKHATSMLHQYSFHPGGQRQDVLAQLANVETSYAFVKAAYLRRTRIPREALEKLLEHDLDLSSEACLKMGIVDRVLFGDEQHAVNPQTLQTAQTPPLRLLLRKTNYNRFSATCDVAADCERLDAMVREGGGELKPLLYYPHRFCYDETHGGPSDPERIKLYHAHAFIPRIQSLPVPSYAVVDTRIEITDFLPALYCTRRYMYENASVVFFLRASSMYGTLLEDRLANTRAFLARLRGILLRHTKLPDALLDDIPRKGFVLSARECLRHGLCDEVIPL